MCGAPRVMEGRNSPSHSNEKSGRRFRKRDCVLGDLYRATGKNAEAVGLLDKALPRLQKQAEKEPKNPAARKLFLNILASRAQALYSMGRSADALRDWDQIDAAMKGQMSPSWRGQRAQALAQAGQHGRACSEAEALAKQFPRSIETLYDAACVFSVASATAAKDDKLGEEERKMLAEKYADRAVALLKDAIGKGYKDADHMKKDTDPDPLRARDDFKELLRSLEKPDP